MRYGLAPVLVVVLVACGGGSSAERTTVTEAVETTAVKERASGTTISAMEGWADEALEWWEGFVESTRHGPWHVVSFLEPDIVWDERTSGEHIVGQGAWVDHQERLQPGTVPWSGVPAMRGLDQPILVSADELVIQYVFDHEFPIHYLDRMTIGPEGVTEWVSAGAVAAARYYVAEDVDVDRVDQVVDAYVALWNGASDVAVSDIYTRGAVLTDSLLDVRLSGDEQIAAAWELESGAAIGRMTLLDLPDGRERAAYCGGYKDDPILEVRFLVDVDDGTGCPGTMAIGLALDGDGVIGERRYHEVESVRRCYDPEDLQQGWWVGRATPETMIIEQTGTVIYGDLRVEVFNGTPAMDGFIQWGLARFEAAGLPLPRVASVRFLRSTAICRRVAGLASAGEVGALITFCAMPEDVCADDGCSEWRRRHRHTLLHELAHPWLDDNVDQPTRDRFLELVELQRWSDHDDPWNQRGVERAANTIAFGLIDEPVTLAFSFQGTCEQRDQGFRLLTGIDPITPCTDVDLGESG